MSYATQEEIGIAMNLNYTMTQDNDRGSSFISGHRRIWACRDGWKTCDLVGDTYKNHQMFDNLTDALRREL